MERYKKIVLEAPEGNSFVVSKEDSGELRIKLIPRTATVYSGDYRNPPIPEGWEHVEGEWDDGFVIQDSKKNQFVWVPVGFLDSNGTLDGTNFSEKFGRRNYCDDEFSVCEFNEEFDCELRKQWESVQKYGGFYIARYKISQNEETGDAQSVKGEMPWTCINWPDAMKEAKGFGNGVSVASHLQFGAEYDSILEWFLESEVASDSIDWDDFLNTHLNTNHICDFAGNIDEWTQEQKAIFYRVSRGGCAFSKGTDFYSIARRDSCEPNDEFGNIGFRAALYIA